MTKSDIYCSNRLRAEYRVSAGGSGVRLLIGMHRIAKDAS